VRKELTEALGTAGEAFPNKANGKGRGNSKAES